MTAEAQELRDVVCTACGCTCDDLTLTVTGSRIAAVAPPCPLAERFFLADRTPPDSLDLAAAIRRAADILHAARAPLVMGFERATVDAQRLVVEIAEGLGAVLDSTDERGMSRPHTAAQTVGAITATLGEVASRSDVVVYWECDPATTHPRRLDRFASRPGRRIIVVANWPTPSAALADEYILIPAGSSSECLWTLRALVRGVSLDPELVEQQTGNALEVWQRLADQLTTAHYAAIFQDAASRRPCAPEAPRPDVTSEALAELARDLHRLTRAAVLSLGAPFNAVGAAQVLTWQTGFPAAISFARGYPQYLPTEATAARLLACREVDAALIVAADPLPQLSPAAVACWKAIPTIVVDDQATESARHATVAIPAATFGIETAGDVYRSDGVALPLRPARASQHPDMADILQQLAVQLSRA
jgi:formylmethanofuran dehydrogenase subunit B